MLGELWLVLCPAGGGGRDVRPAAHLLFFASPKKSRQKKGDPQSATPALRCGADLRRRAGGVRGGTRCAPAALRSNIPRESDHEASASFGAAATPPARRRRRSHRGESETGHRCARPLTLLPLPLGEGWGEGIWGRAQRWPEWSRTPSARAEERRAWGGRVQRSMHALRALTCCGCLNGAPQARSEFRSTAPGPSTAGCPAAQRRGHAQWGRLFFGPFLLAKQKKGTAPPGAYPGLCGLQGNTATTSPNAQKTGLPRRAHP